MKVQDPVFATVVTALVMAGSGPAAREQPEMSALDGRAWALLALGGLVLAVRRIAPVACVAVTFTVSLAYVHFSYPYGPIFFYSMIALYTLAAWRRTRLTLIVTLIVTVVNAAYSWFVEREPDTFTFTMLSSAVWLLAPVVIGLAIRGRREADERARVLERERLSAQERLRMAREVHDAVGHSLAVISVNAGAALHVLAKLEKEAAEVTASLGASRTGLGETAAPPRASRSGLAEVTASLRAIRQASRAGLDELRSTLVAGRPAGLAALPELIAATNVDGLTAVLRVEGDPRELRSTVDGAAYRIVQEALTNVVRHARATTARVTVAYGEQRLTLTIADDGVGGPVTPGGLGLENMRRRARDENGTLQARPDVKGFVVQAVLPYEVPA